MTQAKIVIGATDATAGAFASATARLSALGQAGAGMADKLGKIGGAFAAVAAGGALGAFFRSTVEGIDKLNDLADATGSSIENLSALEDTAARTGTSLDTVGSSLVKLNKTIADAKPGSDAAAALKAIGLTAKELRELDPADALLRVAQGLSRFADDGNKARLTQELFGKSLREVAPLLKDLSEKGQLNATVTTEQAIAAEKFRQNAAALEKDLTDLARTISGPLIESLNKFSADAKKRGFWAAFFTESEEEMAEKRAKYLANKVKKLQAEIAQAVAKGNTELADKLKGQLFLAQGARDFGAEDDSETKRLLARSRAKPSAPVVGDAAAAAEIQKRFDAYLSRLDDGIRATAQLTDAEKLELAIAEKSAELRGFNARQLDILIGKTRALDEVTGKAAEARLRRDRQNQQAESGDQSGNLLVNVDALASQSRAAQIDRLALAMASVRDQMSGAAGSDLVRFQRALAVLDEQMRALENNTQAYGEKLGQFSEELKEVVMSAEDFFGAAFQAQMEGNGRKVDRILGDMLRRWLAQIAAANLTKALFGDMGATGQAGGWLGALFRAIGSGSGSSGGGGFSQAGGTDKFVNAGSSKVSASAVSSKGDAAPFVVNVQGDVGPKAMKAMRTVQAQSEARQQRRYAMGSA